MSKGFKRGYRFLKRIRKRVIMSYESAFEQKKSAMETVTFMAYKERK